MRAKIERRICDKCEKEEMPNNKIIGFGINHDRYCDAAGDMDDMTIYFDLCQRCQRELIVLIYSYRSKMGSVEELKKWLKYYENMGG